MVVTIAPGGAWLLAGVVGLGGRRHRPKAAPAVPLRTLGATGLPAADRRSAASAGTLVRRCMGG